LSKIQPAIADPTTGTTRITLERIEILEVHVRLVVSRASGFTAGIGNAPVPAIEVVAGTAVVAPAITLVPSLGSPAIYCEAQLVDQEGPVERIALDLLSEETGHR
jgi:hypothetical protein